MESDNYWVKQSKVMEMLDVFCFSSEYHVSDHGWRRGNQPTNQQKKQTKNIQRNPHQTPNSQQPRTGLLQKEAFTKWQFISKVTIWVMIDKLNLLFRGRNEQMHYVQEVSYINPIGTSQTENHKDVKLSPFVFFLYFLVKVNLILVLWYIYKF